MQSFGVRRVTSGRLVALLGAYTLAPGSLVTIPNNGESLGPQNEPAAVDFVLEHALISPVGFYPISVAVEAGSAALRELPGKVIKLGHKKSGVGIHNRPLRINPSEGYPFLGAIFGDENQRTLDDKVERRGAPYIGNVEAVQDVKILPTSHRGVIGEIDALASAMNVSDRLSFTDIPSRIGAAFRFSRTSISVTRSLPGIPSRKTSGQQREKSYSKPTHAKPESAPRPNSGFVSSVRRLPLSAQVGATIILALLAALIWLCGFIRFLEGRGNVAERVLCALAGPAIFASSALLWW